MQVLLDFKPVYSTSNALSVARFVATRYGLAAPIDCHMLSRGFNDVFHVAAATGERYVFRLSDHRARGPADVQTETDFLAHLRRSNVPVAAPIPARDGRLYVRGAAPEGVREGVLFEALDGRAPEATSTADARANGVTLALMHSAAGTFVPSAPPLYRLDLDYLLRRPLARVHDNGTIKDDRTRDDLDGLAARAAERIEGVPDLAWTHCHGDCHGFNARINAAGVAAFFDFDDGGPGYLAYDLAVFLWAKVSFGRTLLAMWEAFLEGYRAIRAIAPRDLEAVQAFVVVRHIWLMGEYASRAHERGGESVGWIGREVEFLRRWEDERLAGRLI